MFVTHHYVRCYDIKRLARKFVNYISQIKVIGISAQVNIIFFHVATAIENDGHILYIVNAFVSSGRIHIIFLTSA